MSIPNALATYMTYRFASNLTKPFTEWEAYKLGLIDEKGKVVRSSKTTEERAAMNPANNLVRKIKRILLHFTRDSKMLNFIIAAYLIKESENINEDQERLVEMLEKELDKEEQVHLYSILVKASQMNLKEKHGN